MHKNRLNRQVRQRRQAGSAKWNAISRRRGQL